MIHNSITIERNDGRGGTLVHMLALLGFSGILQMRSQLIGKLLMFADQITEEIFNGRIADILDFHSVLTELLDETLLVTQESFDHLVCIKPFSRWCWKSCDLQIFRYIRNSVTQLANVFTNFKHGSKHSLRLGQEEVLELLGSGSQNIEVVVLCIAGQQELIGEGPVQEHSNFLAGFLINSNVGNEAFDLDRHG